MATAAIARRDLTKKLRFERMLANDMRAFNRRLTRLMVRSQAKGTGVLDASTLQPELSGILAKHYNRVAPAFDSQISEILPKDIEATETETDAIAVALTTFFAARAPEQAEIITATNQQNITASIDQTVDISQEEAAEGRPQGRIDIAVVAGAILSRKLASRVPGIASLETQAPSETAKATEAQVLMGQPPSVTGGTLRETLVTKEWVTVGDERVRQSHASADGQQQDLNTPFTVGGQSLRFPGDTSLGATAGNVINCRCSSVVSQEDVFAERRRREEEAVIDVTASDIMANLHTHTLPDGTETSPPVIDLFDESLHWHTVNGVPTSSSGELGGDHTHTIDGETTSPPIN